MKRFLAILAFAAICAGLSAQGDAPRRWAIVNTSVCYLRLKPDYESPLETQSLMGTVVELLQTDRYWRQVSTPDPYVAWTNDLALAYVSEEQKDAYIAAPKWICVAEYGHVLSGPSADSGRLCDLVMGDLLRQTGEPQAGGRTKVLLPDGREGWVDSASLADFGQWAASREPSGDKLAATAMKFLGVPYLWGGISPKGFDCSGLVKFCYMMNGVLLKRNASQQVKCGAEVPLTLDCLQPGDLLFFGSPAEGKKPMKVTHVGLYLGGGMMIHSSQVVRLNSIVEGAENWYGRAPIAARRMIGHEGEDGITPIGSSAWYFQQ